jgi:cytochrome d ubiquinol oxidase subunit II
VPVLAVVLLAGVGWLMRERLEGWAFVGTALVVLLFFVTLLLNLYPNVLVSSVNPHFDLTIVGSASHTYTLKVMSIVAVIFTPFVLLYQGWSYWVFRQRVRRPEAHDSSVHA